MIEFMTNKKRTITELRNNLIGKVHIYLKDEKICNEFLRNAEQDGFRFGNIMPTENRTSDIIALEKNKQMSYAGVVGHMAFRCPSAVIGEYHRIDYYKFIKGYRNYYYKDNR